MDKVGFFTAVRHCGETSAWEKALDAIDSFFSVRGQAIADSSAPLEKSQEVDVVEEPLSISKTVWKVFKMFSACCVGIGIILFGIKAVYRLRHSFHKIDIQIEPSDTEECLIRQAVMERLMQAGRARCDQFTEQDRVRAHLAMSISGTVAKHGGTGKKKNTLLRKVPLSGSVLSSAIEKEAFQSFNQQGALSDLRETLQLYQKNIERSESLNLAIASLRDLNTEPECQEALQALSQEIICKLRKLLVGESLYLDFAHYKHAMRLVIKRQETDFLFRLCDSSGGAQRIYYLGKSFGKIKLLLSGLNKRKNTALEFAIRDFLFLKHGCDYFRQLFHRATGKNRKEEEEAVQKGVGIPGYKILCQLQKFKKTVDCFRAIEGLSRPAILSPLLQGRQSTNNCYAKRIQTNQLHELGRGTYKKVRLEMLRFHRENILSYFRKIFDKKEMAQLEQIPIQKLAIRDLKDLCKEVSLFSEIPRRLDKASAILKIMNHNISKRVSGK